MQDEQLIADYNGYSILVSTTSADGPSFGSTVFSVGLRGEVIVSGVIRETFKSAQEAHQAACAAAHKLIDEHRSKLMGEQWAGVRK